jgi:chromosome segregation ATPase
MDQELIAYLEERFRESSRQMQSFREETSRQIAGLSGEVGSLREETRSRFEQVDEALRENRDEIRHTQIVMESMRSDIQGVAEGVLSTNQRLDAFREEVQQEFKEVRYSTRLAYGDMDKRVLSLEDWRKRVGEDPAPRVRKKS